MSRWRRAARVDDNQKDIVDALRGIPGVSVEVGHDDILVGYKRRTFWFEVKGEGKRKRLRPSQKRLAAGWTGHYAIVSTIDEVLKEIGIG